ncbi:hypothetical protein QBC43DRAFT_271562 [Cladorrhinum sp. PSN259]|nr:hypothetical protein QBC43DRAFT_271562 [Cladorrhinum sp. PSN259]
MAERVYIPMTKNARDALIGISFLWCINGFVVFFRLVGRVRGIGIGADDILAVVAFLISGATIGFNAAEYVSGVGRNFDPNSPYFADLANNLPFILKMTFIFTLFYLWALVSLKLSQLCFYYRAFSVQLKFWIYISFGIIAVWGIVFTFLFTFLCTPIDLQWSLGDRTGGKCMDQITVLKSIIMSNVLTDVLIVILPMRTVWSLQMRTTEKLAVAGCFAIGLACVLIGIVRFWQIYVIDLIGNLTGTSLTTFMLCSVELMLAGICINIPMLRPFYLRWRQKYKSSGQDSSYLHGGNSRKPSNNVPTVGSTPGNYTAAWIELEDDKELGESDSHGDGSSQVNLTRTPAPITHSIQVSKEYKVERT